MKRSCLTTLVLCAGAVLVSFTDRVAAQNETQMVNELYKSRAEAINAEALNKQANASIINANANFMKAQAESAKLQQETREKSAQNDLLETKVYYEKRSLYHGYKEAHRPKAATPEQHASRAAKAAPNRLADSQLWSKPGYLRWPSMLLHTPYVSPRGQLDQLFHARCPQDSGAGSQNCVEIQTRIDELQAILVSNMKRYRTADYLAAKKFLAGLSLEAQYPVEVDGTAGQLAKN